MLVQLQSILPQQLLTKSFGYLANSTNPLISNYLKTWIVNKYKVDLSIAKYPNIKDYASLQDLFTREIDLKHRDKIINDNSIISPADSCISQVGKINNNTLVQAKGFKFTTESLLNNSKYADMFTNGSYATLYLAPHDYHRVHMPTAGKLIHQNFIPGKLFSVNNYTANNVNNLFARNERLCCIFETKYGLMAQVMVGAMIVGSILTVWGGNSHTQQPITPCDFNDGPQLDKGEHMGTFAFGSTVITLFQNSKMSWNKDLRIGQKLKVLQAMGKADI
ncbi:MAG: phosphatidylserine decarboxylase [Francisellaceae bacterium]|jgi:phosphatidylserine decarboxylase|nr:phosphatidylserine decarboxylase [Francisellaceae bacterium]MBT6539382.1 phosphatidylserine decarboxylase [Francisellaceae bacterium]